MVTVTKGDLIALGYGPSFHVQSWQLELAKQFSPNYIHVVQGLLSLAFDRAIVLGIAKKNPSRMIGMRIGEAAALLWSDIDFDTGLLSITKTMYYRSMDDFKPVEPKTQASVRIIYVDADTIRELKAWQEVQKKVLKNCDYVLSYREYETFSVNSDLKGLL